MQGDVDVTQELLRLRIPILPLFPILSISLRLQKHLRQFEALIVRTLNLISKAEIITDKAQAHMKRRKQRQRQEETEGGSERGTAKGTSIWGCHPESRSPCPCPSFPIRKAVKENNTFNNQTLKKPKVFLKEKKKPSSTLQARAGCQHRNGSNMGIGFKRMRMKKWWNWHAKCGQA